MQADFHQSEFDQPHPQRTRAILKAHPEVRGLMSQLSQLAQAIGAIDQELSPERASAGTR